MIILYCVVLFFCIIRRKEYVTYQHIAFVSLLLIFIATFRSSTLPDYDAYLGFKLDAFDDERYEPSIFLIRSLSDWVSSSYYTFFFIYALLAVVIKLCALNQLTDLFFLSLLCYIGMDFPIHEMIQMRAAVAQGIMLWSFIFIYEKRLVLYAWTVLLAVFFHYSALLILPLYLLKPYSINKKLHIIMLFISFVIGLTKIGFTYLVQFVPIEFVQGLFQAYQYQTFVEEEFFSPFSMTIIVLTITQIILLLKADKIRMHNRYIYLLLKVQSASIISFFLFNDMPIVGGRISEFYRIAFIVSVPFVIYICNNRIVARLIVVVLCSMFYLRFLTLYYW